MSAVIDRRHTPPATCAPWCGDGDDAIRMTSSVRTSHVSR